MSTFAFLANPAFWVGAGAATSIAGTAYSIATGSKTPSASSMPSAPSASEAEEKARKEQLERERRRKGRGATILTDSQGLLAKAPTTAKTLLGS